MGAFSPHAYLRQENQISQLFADASLASLRSEGYTVFANTEASGTFSHHLASDANRRMENAGVILQGFFAIVMDLMRDWRNKPGSAELLPFLDRYLPVYGYVAMAHEAAELNGTLLPGEEGL